MVPVHLLREIEPHKTSRALWDKGAAIAGIAMGIVALVMWGTWPSLARDAAVPTEADALRALLIERAAALTGCTAGSPEEAELEAIRDAIKAYETVRWPAAKSVRRKIAWE
jgi:hypothetical protein